MTTITADAATRDLIAAMKLNGWEKISGSESINVPFKTITTWQSGDTKITMYFYASRLISAQYESADYEDTDNRSTGDYPGNVDEVLTWL